jgi:phosphoserine phosphatase RsbU/P
MELRLSIMNAIRFVVAVLVTVSAALAAELFVARSRRRELSLLYFALGAGAYAARLLLQALGRNGGTGVLLLTLFIPIPLILFMVETVAPEWKKVTGWIIAANLMVAVFALLAFLLHLGRGLAWSANNILALIELPLIIGMTFFPRRPPDHDLQISRAGILVFLLVAIYTNLQGLGFAPGPNLEFLGFVVVLSCLGDVALRRTLRNEERLLTLHKELEIARDIQARLLPRPASSPAALTIASRYVPATSVAGDFYDFLVQDGTLGVLIADVSGHGIPAALSASMVKVAIRAQMERAHDPADVLRGMNSILCGNLEGQFVSAGYLFLDPDRGTLAYAGAGHPPLLIWRSGRQAVETLEENGLLLGIFPASSYKERSAALARGDRCLLYTDGLLEATRPSGEEFGPERLESFLAGHAGLPAEAFCDRLVHELSAWCGPPRQPHDDLTIVVIDFV